MKFTNCSAKPSVIIVANQAVTPQTASSRAQNAIHVTHSICTRARKTHHVGQKDLKLLAKPKRMLQLKLKEFACNKKE